MIPELMRSESLTVAPYAKTGEVHLRITARSESMASAKALVIPMEAKIRHTLGTAVYAVDETTLEETIMQILREKDAKLATIESLTGGMVSARLTSVPGSSEVYVGGVVAYTRPAKLLSGI